MKTQYIYDNNGYLCGIYEGTNTQPNSTIIPPIYTEGLQPQFLNGAWVDQSKTPEIKVSPVEFKLLWTPQERAAIKALRTTDPIVENFYEIIDDPRLTFVNLSLTSTQQAVDYLLYQLVAAAVITETDAPVRRAAILSGEFL